MANYTTTITNTFEHGSIRDANILFEACVKNAFPTFNFRNLELIRFLWKDQYMEGKSWNHVFEICATKVGNSLVWEVNCRRVTMGKTPDKQVYLDYTTLDFARYKA